MHVLAVDVDEKGILAKELLQVLSKRRTEALSDDYSRMAWLAIHVKDLALAREFVRAGLQLEPENPYLLKLAEKLKMAA